MGMINNNGLISNTECEKCKCGKMKFSGLKIKNTYIGTSKYLSYECNNPECKNEINKPYLSNQMTLFDYSH